MFHRIKKIPQLSFRRFEFKYHLPLAVADRLIPQVMNYMNWDESVGEKDYYEVNSLYFDSRDFKCYHEKISGLMNRKKARIRTYSKILGPTSDIYFELKRKAGEVILKDRIIVKTKDSEKFSENPFSLCEIDEYRGNFLNEFLFEISMYQMKPVVLVSYKRKPFYSKFDKRFRVTFDYDLGFAKPNAFNFDADYKMLHDFVIMEVKFNGAMPKWFHDIIEMYRLNKEPFSKYCAGVESVYGLPKYF